MIYSPEDMIKRIHDTKAVSIWNSKTGPIFWYAANVPGPFYVNTELVIGPDLSAKLLKDITALIAETKDATERAQKLEKMMMEAFETNETFRNVIETMVARAKTEFPDGSYTALSGGERRDWLFSIPMAKLLNIKHVYLFKNGEYTCASPLQKEEKALHISDLINNAASYFDNWLPILEKAGLSCIGTLCVNSRGSNGVDRLKANGQKVVALNSIDIGFFEKSLATGLIDAGTLDELRVFFASSKEWTSAHVMERPELFTTEGKDQKTLDRMKIFFTKDPLELKDKHPAFFAAMQTRVA